MDKPETESKLTVKRDGILYKLNSRELRPGIVFQTLQMEIWSFVHHM